MMTVITNDNSAAVLTRPDIIVVEDSDADFDGLVRVLRRFRPHLLIERCRDGEEALHRISSADASNLPALVLLDLNLPGTDGRRVLERLRADPGLAGVPIVVLTTSSNPRDVEQCYVAGANGYLFKPVDFALFEVTIRGAVDYWLAGPDTEG